MMYLQGYEYYACGPFLIVGGVVCFIRWPDASTPLRSAQYEKKCWEKTSYIFLLW
jgi:hypothetical protein